MTMAIEAYHLRMAGIILSNNVQSERHAISPFSDGVNEVKQNGNGTRAENNPLTQYPII